MPNTNDLLSWLMEHSANDQPARPPDVATLREILRKTLEDARLSKSEKDMLHDCIWNQGRTPDETRLTILRRAAFDLVAEGLERSDRKEILEWLHDIVELLIPRQPTTLAPTNFDTQVLFSRRDPCADRISGLIQESRSTIELCVFTITDNRLTQSILDAAGRGLKIRLITDDLKSEDLGSDIVRIAAAGVPVKIDRSPFHMHHKFAIFDARTILTGSYNWTRTASDENHENILVSRDLQTVKPFSQEFEHLWNSLNLI